INGIIGIYLKEIGVSGKVITTFHGYDMSEFICQNGNNVYNLLFHEGDLFLPVSNYWKQKLINLNCESNKIIVHHMGIDLEKFKFMEKAIKQREPIKILTIGRLTEKKGHKYAIKAIGKLIRKHKNILYIIAGDGELRSTLESLTSKLGIKNHVTFLGVVEEDEVLNLYRDADIFLLPSITSDTGDQEGIPIVLIEAHATGLPVVSTFHTGIPEIVINGKSGFLVPEKNVDALAERLDFLVSHPALWEKMGKEGREHIEKYFNIKTQIMLLEKIYRKIIKKV
ncbi:glycosyltransferase, partial [Candidatus Dependentiae bacterium]|nr:glycosyltransferase [Candidatus Dependentiae bacterium]